MIRRNTKETISPTYSYDEIVFSATWTRLSFTFNEYYSLETSKIRQDTLNRKNLCKCEIESLLWECLRLKCSIALMKPRSVQGRNEHNHENQQWLGKELCGYYCFDLHQQLNNSRYHVH